MKNGTLKAAVHRVETLHYNETGKHALSDHKHPAIDWKTATVDLKKTVKHYIPITGPNGNVYEKIAVAPGQPLDRAIKTAYALCVL